MPRRSKEAQATAFGLSLTLAGAAAVYIGWTLLGWIFLLLGLGVTIAMVTESPTARGGGALLGSIVVAVVLTLIRGDEPPQPDPVTRLAPPRERKPELIKLTRVEVTAKEFGKKWPLTVEQGFLRCEEIQFERVSSKSSPARTYTISFETVDGTIYATTSSNQYAGIDPIWAKDPKAASGVDARKDIAPLNKKGFDLCKQLNPLLLPRDI